MLSMLKTDPIVQLMDDLPETGLTVHMLKGLDFVVPGQWHNITGFEPMVRTVTAETNPARLEAIGVKAQALYADPQQNYQKAVWLYQAVDISDKVLAAAALANKLGERINILSFLNRLTPKTDVTQSLDFGLKLTAEMVAYSLVHGIPREGVVQFVQSLGDYQRENIMRLATLVCVDGLLPLGPDFLLKVGETLGQLQPGDLQKNPIYQQVGSLIPGETPGEQLGFVRQVFGSAQTWLNDFQTKHNLTPDVVLGSLKSSVQFSDEGLDYVAAFVDASTNYYYHTGVQSVARSLILEAHKQVPLELTPPSTANSGSGRPGKRRGRQTGQSASTGSVGAGASLGTVAELQAKTQQLLEALNLPYELDGDEMLSVALDACVIYLIPFEWENLGPLLELQTTVVSEVYDPSKKAAIAVLEENTELPFGSLAYFESQNSLNLTHTLPAALLTQDTLALVLTQLTAHATDLADELADLLDGRADIKLLRGQTDLPQAQSGQNQSATRRMIEGYLDELGLDYEEDNKVFSVEVGSTVVYISTYDWSEVPQVVVELAGTLSSEYEKISRSVAVELLTLAATETALGGVHIDNDDETIYLSYNVPGEAVTAEVLGLLLEQVGAVADTYDNDIASATDGYREADY